MLHIRSLILVAGLGTAASAAACGLVTSGVPDASSSGSGAAPMSSGSSTGGGGQGGAAVTCASADCETLPEGWTLVRAQRVDSSDAGPGAGDAGDASLPACGSGVAPTVYFYGPVDPACGPCTCGQPAGFSCSSPQVTCSYSTDNCGGKDIQRQDDSDGDCTMYWAPAGFNSSGSCQLTASPHVTQQGSCDAQGGGVTPVAPFAGAVAVCPQPTTAVGCTSGRSCLPSGATAEGAVCITRPDDTPCPAGWNTDVIPAFEGAADSRACAACACDVACQGGSYTVWGDDTCGGNSVSIEGTSCVQVSLFSWSSCSVEAHVGTAMVASCDSPDPSGIVAATGVHQICCR